MILLYVTSSGSLPADAFISDINAKAFSKSPATQKPLTIVEKVMTSGTIGGSASRISFKILGTSSISPHMAEAFRMVLNATLLHSIPRSVISRDTARTWTTSLNIAKPFMMFEYTTVLTKGRFSSSSQSPFTNFQASSTCLLVTKASTMQPKVIEVGATP